MGLWEDANNQLNSARATEQSDANAHAALIETQQRELQEFRESMHKLGVRPRAFELRGWLSKNREDSYNVRSGQSVSGWAIASWR